MTESEYINATNLAKIRAVRKVFDDVLPWEFVTDDDWGEISRLLWKMEEILTRHVKTKAKA